MVAIVGGLSSNIFIEQKLNIEKTVFNYNKKERKWINKSIVHGCGKW